MRRTALRKGFGVYSASPGSSSGHRFFAALCRTLADKAVPLDQRPAAILFNVSAPLKAILTAKFRGQKVVLRIDGLYIDRLSPDFLDTFSWPLRQFLSIGARYSWAHDFLAHVANMINCNYTAFARILLADRIIYQSKFSHAVHRRYFRNKAYDIIVNGSVFQGETKSTRGAANSEIGLVTIYDQWRTSKRISDLVEFVRWAYESKKMPIRLTILGYTGELVTGAPSHIKALIESSPFIVTLPKFESFTGKIRETLLDSDIYITFTNRDPCPNAVVEAMAHGLPVVGVASGGVPDIVGDAGVLLHADDFVDGFFSSFRYGCDFPPIDYERMLDAVLTVSSSRQTFQARVQERFATDLGINVVAERYASAMRSLVD